jgi:hypothetical protein
MKTYRVMASSVEYYYLDIEAESEDKAWDIAYHADGGDFKSYAMGDWQIDGVEDAK